MQSLSFAGAGGISFYRVMPTFHNPIGMNAYIMNMDTAPEYRRKGIARHALDLLVNEEKLKNIHFISLEATDLGYPLYSGYGFQVMEHGIFLPESFFPPQIEEAI